MSRRVLALWPALLLAACFGGQRYEGDLGEIEFAQFEAADTDLNGRLDRAEVEAAFPMWMPHFERIDSDSSGFVSWPEARATQRPVLRPPPAP